MPIATTPENSWSQLHIQRHSLYDGQPAVLSRKVTTQESIFALWLVREGSVDVRLHGWQQKIRAGTWIFLPPHLRRSHDFAPQTRILSFRCSLSLPGTLLHLGSLPATWPLAKNDALEFQLVDLLRLSHPAQNSLEECRLRSGLTLVVASLLEHMQSLGIFLEAQEIHDQRLLKAIKILESQSCPGPLPWPKLLQETGMSRSGLERLFSRRFSQNLTSWHESRILEHITSALADPHKSIASIATQFGFQDPSNFNRWFRRITGTSPGRYRHNVQG